MPSITLVTLLGPLFAVAGACQLLAILLQHRGYTYLSHPHLLAWLYAAGTLSMLHIYSSTFSGPVSYLPAYLLAVWCVAVTATATLNHLRPIPLAYRQRHPKSYFLNFNLTFITVKITDILFQQIFLLTLFTLVRPLVPHTATLSLLTVSIFALAHLPLILLQKKISTLHLLGATLCVGIVPWVLTHVTGGFWYLVGGHWLFYITIRLAMGIPPLRRSLLGQDIPLATP